MGSKHTVYLKGKPNSSEIICVPLQSMLSKWSSISLCNFSVVDWYDSYHNTCAIALVPVNTDTNQIYHIRKQ